MPFTEVDADAAAPGAASQADSVKAARKSTKTARMLSLLVMNLAVQVWADTHSLKKQ
jgi:hypothetical protein